MAQSFLFGIHWSHAGKMYYDELLAGATDELVNYFNLHKRSDVTLVHVELWGPEDMPDEQALRRPARIVTDWWRKDYDRGVGKHRDADSG